MYAVLTLTIRAGLREGASHQYSAEATTHIVKKGKQVKEWLYGKSWAVRRCRFSVRVVDVRHAIPVRLELRWGGKYRGKTV